MLPGLFVSFAALLLPQLQVQCFAPPPALVRMIRITRRFKANDKPLASSSSSSDENLDLFGMEAAFAKLNDLEYMDDIVQEGDDTINDLEPRLTLEEEMKLYEELSLDLEQVQASLILESEEHMEPTATVLPTIFQPQDEFLDDDIALKTVTSTDFFDRAFEQAMEEMQGTTELTSSIRNDGKLMKEIEAIFNKGNDELMANLQEIREEQNMLVTESAKRSAQRLDAAMAADQIRMQAAQASLARIMNTVQKEEQQVQQAVTELQEAQAELNKDPLTKILLTLKQGGIVKQGALVGAILFASRAVSESVAMSSLDGGSHATAALIQGVIASVCAIYFFVF